MSWKLQWKTPVLYTDTLFEPIARRARQQLNENSKILCRHAVIPEMNHNEILGRSSQNNQIAPLFIRHTYEHTRNSYRIELTKEIVWPLVDEIIELQAIGSSLIEQMMTTIYILDRVSVYQRWSSSWRSNGNPYYYTTKNYVSKKIICLQANLLLFLYFWHNH